MNKEHQELKKGTDWNYPRKSTICGLELDGTGIHNV